MGEFHRNKSHRWSPTGVRPFIVALAVAIGLLASSVDKAYAANGSVTYTYDALGRVQTVSYDTGIIIIYTYDANGNRTQQVINVNTSVLHWAPTASPCTSNCWGQAVWG